MNDFFMGRLRRHFFVATWLLVLWPCAEALAQMKVGSNPTTLASDANLQVEASDGKQVVVRKSTAQVGIGTSSPANNLEVNSGTANASGVRLTQVTSASVLGTNSNGDIIKSSNTCTCGQIVASIVTLPSPWKKLDGSTAGTNSCGLGVLPNASNMALVQGGTAGTTSTATGVRLAQNQLPDVRWTGSFKVSGGSGGIDGASGVFSRSGGGGNTFSPNGNWWDSGVTNFNLNLNGAVTQQAITLSTANLPRLNVDWFVCVN